MFLSSSGAYGRAWLLRAYGAFAEVYASDPVTWPGTGPGWESESMSWSPDLRYYADARDNQLTEQMLAALLGREEAAA
jgi:hypothetical protein